MGVWTRAAARGRAGQRIWERTGCGEAAETTWNTDTSNVYDIFFFYRSGRLLGTVLVSTVVNRTTVSIDFPGTIENRFIRRARVSNFRSIPTIAYLPVRFGKKICGTFSKSFAQERAALFTGKTCSCFPFEHKCAFRSYFQCQPIRLGTISTVFRNFG